MPPPNSSIRSAKTQSLMDTLRQKHTGKRPSKLPTTKRAKATTVAYDFSKHPAYSEVRIAKAASETIGVGSPYFRVVQEVDGTRVKIDGRWVRNFASYDYLSLNGTSAVRDGARAAVAEWGVSATASRLVGGETTMHGTLEKKLADFLRTEAALALVSGHGTNMALVSTLVGPGDLVLVDSLAHNSIYEGIRRSGAAHATFPHNDHRWVDDHLATMRDKHKNVLIAVEGLYSMDGDAPDLPRFIALKERHNAWLFVDEAHSVGVLGETGRGICEASGVDPKQIEVIMGTLSKSFCSCGGFVAGSAALIDLVRYRAPGFVYSVGLSAPNTAAAIGAVDAIVAEPNRLARLRDVGQTFRTRAQKLGLDTGESQGHAICPIIIGDSLQAVWISNRLLEAGFNVLPIIAPAVPDRSARLRFFLNSDHDEASIAAVLKETAKLKTQASKMSITEMASG
ncbi:MAG: aminotransferase class I/II-fold pyridoxal phosphate-dependent enzyme [Pseudomonadota bacterium]